MVAKEEVVNDVPGNSSQSPICNMELVLLQIETLLLLMYLGLRTARMWKALLGPVLNRKPRAPQARAIETPCPILLRMWKSVMS